MSKYTFPERLRPGDTIGVVAPSSSGSAEELALATEALKNLGFQVVWPLNIHAQHHYMAGDDALRLKAFHKCWENPKVKAIWCLRGGYGSTRLLPYLDFSLFQRQPKIFIGMSDITALHAAIGKCSNLVTFLGPNLNFLYGKQDDPSKEFSKRAFWDLMDALYENRTYELKFPPEYVDRSHTIQPGTAEGRLVGGNLALLCSLIGTPWQLDTRKSILFLEDVNEKPYRIDRLLTQMQQTGQFDKIKGLLISHWIDEVHPENSEERNEVLRIFKSFFNDAPFPVLFGVPSGHLNHQSTLPLNATVHFDAVKKSIRLLSKFALN